MKLIVVGTVVILVIVVIVAVILGSQTGGKSTQTTQTKAVASPSQLVKYTSPKYNYSFSYPSGWYQLDVGEYRQKYVPANPTLPDPKKQMLDEYYSKVDVMFQKSAKETKPRVLVRVNDKEGITLADEVENHRQFLKKLYTDLTYVVDGPAQFQNQDAYRTETRGIVSKNELHAKEVIFTRSNLVITMAMITDEVDWTKDLDVLFEQIISSFSI